MCWFCRWFVVGWIACHSLLIIFHFYPLSPSPAIAHFHLKQMMRTWHLIFTFVHPLRLALQPSWHATTVSIFQQTAKNIPSLGTRIISTFAKRTTTLDALWLCNEMGEEDGGILINRQLLKVIKAATNWIFRTLSSRTFLLTRATTTTFKHIVDSVCDFNLKVVAGI